MTVMSRGLKALLVFVVSVWLSSCKEEPVLEREAKVTREVEVTLLGLEEAIDWNREMELISGDAYLEWAAEEAGIDVATLDEAVHLELDPKRKVISVIAQDLKKETAAKYADTVVTSLKLARLKAEMNVVAPEIEKEGSLESDQMTYEKARKLLEEEAAAEDGVLYRKEE